MSCRLSCPRQGLSRLRSCAAALTRPPEHPPGPSLLAGPVAPAAGPSRLPLAVRPGMALGHWHWHWHWLASMLLAPHRQVGKWRAPLPLAAGLCPPLPGWSRVRQSSTHAPLLLLHPLCCTRRRTLTLTLSYSHSHSVGRSGLSFFLCCRPLSSLSFFLLPTFLTCPRQSTPFPRETALSCPPSPHESAAFMVCFVFSPLSASSESPCPSRRILSSP